MGLRRTIAGKKKLGKAFRSKKGQVIGSNKAQVDEPDRTRVDDEVVDSAQLDDNQIDKPDATQVDNEVIVYNEVIAFQLDEDWNKQTAEKDVAFVEHPVCSSEDKTERF